jgi:hypothetical protein
VTPRQTPDQQPDTGSREPQQLRDQSPNTGRFHRVLQGRLGTRGTALVVAAFAACGLLAVIILLLPNLAQVFYPLSPADPDIEPINAEGGPSFIPPFIVRNSNPIFDMANVGFRCGVDLVYFQDADSNTALLRDVAFITGNYSIRANGGQMKYDCDISGLLRIQPDGFISFREPMATSHAEFREPLRILKMCLWIAGTYNVWGHYASFTSKIFQWPAKPGVNQWAEEPSRRDPQKEAASPEWPPSAAWALRTLYTQFFPRKLLPDALECSEAVKFPYLLFPNSGRPILVGPDRSRPGNMDRNGGRNIAPRQEEN